MHQPIDSDSTERQTGRYEDMLRSASRSLKVNSMFFPRVGMGLNMSSQYARRLADDLERIANEHKADSS